VQVQSHAQWKSPQSGAIYPQRWTIRIPTLDLTLHLEPVLAAPIRTSELLAGSERNLGAR